MDKVPDKTLLLEREIIYIGDPMCSWCWGFAPVLDQLIDNIVAESTEEIGFKIVLGGLRPGKYAEPLDEQVKRIIKSHWVEVEKATGQKFDHSFFDRKGFLYDTEPASRAVAAVRLIDRAKEFEFFRILQRAFYAHNIDITRAHNYGPLVDMINIDRNEFYAVFHDPKSLTEVRMDFAQTREWEIGGFPSVILRKQEELALLTEGYRPYNSLCPAINRFFD